MIGLDTNVLVRYVTQDDPVQSPKATELIERKLSAESPGFVSLIAFAETAWVLRSVFGFSGPKLVDALKRLLLIETLIVEHEHEVYSAIRVLQDGRGSFSDGLIAALGVGAGCKHTLTLDEQAARLPQFKQI